MSPDQARPANARAGRARPAHARPVRVVLDVDDDVLAAELEAAFTPHRVHRVVVTSGPVATAAVVDHDAAIVVVAPARDLLGGGGDPDDRHRRLALRARHWAVAVGVVGARLVWRSGGEVFSTDGADEFRTPDATSAHGYALRAAEAEVRAAHPAGVVVRAPDGADADALAATLRWASVVDGPGPWHHPDPTGRLADRHTRLVRADGGPPA